MCAGHLSVHDLLRTISVQTQTFRALEGAVISRSDVIIHRECVCVCCGAICGAVPLQSQAFSEEIIASIIGHRLLELENNDVHISE